LGKGNQVVTQLLFNIEASTAQLKTQLSSAQNQISSFGQTVSKIGGLIGSAFAIKEVLAFGFELSKIAAEAQGVQSAFQKLPNSTKLLQDMRGAVEGTVDDLNLMKLGVNALNNNVPLENLAEILQFVDKTADSTGKDFKTLADTIINNVGKGSTKGLNELGLSIENIQSQSKSIGFVPALLEEIRKKNESLGVVSSDNADSLDRLSASWDNYKLAVGQSINETGIIRGSMEALSGTLDLLASKNLSFWDKLGALLGGTGGQINAVVKDITGNAKKAAEEQKKHEQVVKEVSRAFVEFNGNLEAYSRAIQTHIYKTELLAEFTQRLKDIEDKKAKSVENIANLTERQNVLLEQQKVLTGNALAQTNQELALIDKKIKKLRELGTVQNTGLQFNPDTKTASATASTKFSEKDLFTPEMGAQITDLTARTEELTTAWDSFGATVKDNISGIAVNAIEGLGNALGKLFAGQKVGFKDFVKVILDGIKQVLVALLAKAIGEQIAANSSAGIVGVALAVAGIAAVTALFASKVPAFEKGGIAPGGLSLVGERGAELVNLPAGSRVHNSQDTMRMLNNSGGVLDITINGVFRGEDLYYQLVEVNRRRGKSI
jgi:hypothetical protein